MIVQIYEIQTPEEARKLAGLGVDTMGAVVESETDWKNPTLSLALARIREMGARTSLIPLFTDPETILRVVGHYQPDILHFCDTLFDRDGGALPTQPLARTQARVRAAFPEVELMRSVPVPVSGAAVCPDPLPLLDLFEPVTDTFLIDTWLGHEKGQPKDPVQGYIGITGLTCDWGVARAVVRKTSRPVILAGGLGPSNVAAGIRHVRPAGVDSCTNTNAVDASGRAIRFCKDPEKVRVLVREARAAAAQIYSAT